MNWSLVEDDITPRGESFRNPSAKLLLQKVPRNSGAAVDPSTKALHVDASSSAAESSFPSLLSSVIPSLSDVDAVYVVDAAVGSFRGSEVLARVVSDCPAAALQVQHLLVKVGGASDERSGADHPIKVFHSSDSEAASIATHVSSLSATIAVEGPLDVRQLQQAIQDVASQLMDTGEGELNVLPLPGRAFVDKSGDTVVEIDVSEDGATASDAKVPKGASLYGLNGTVWSQAGLARLFGGAVVSSAAAKTQFPESPGFGDVVLDGGKSVLTSFRADNLIAHPSKIVFVGAGKKASAKTFEKVARTEEQAAEFAQLVKQHNVKISGR